LTAVPKDASKAAKKAAKKEHLTAASKVARRAVLKVE